MHGMTPQQDETERSAIEIVANDAADVAEPEAQRWRDIERRLARIERQCEGIAGIVSAAPYAILHKKIRPRLWSPQQYSSRRLRPPARYALERAPADAPSIAIVTPSLNQGDFIAATIDSVLQQSYPHLAYLVQDGGSRDDTPGVLRRYRDKLAWRSQPDSGQAQAINRGFAAVTGDIMAYLNSDDTLLPGTLAYVAKAFQAHPEVDIVYGHRIYVDEAGFDIGRCVLPAHDTEALKWADYVPQETLFWRRRVWDKVGPFDETFQFALDWDFILRAQAAGFRFMRLPRFLACFRVHDLQKTSDRMNVGTAEMQRLRTRSLGETPGVYEIRRGIAAYIFRHTMVDWGYRLGLLRY